MKKTINGKRYNTDRCEVLGKYDHYNHSNTYSGTTYLLRASDGTMLEYTNSNGQDCWLTDDLCEADLGVNEWGGRGIDRYNMDDNQIARCAELGLIKVVD